MRSVSGTKVREAKLGLGAHHRDAAHISPRAGPRYLNHSEALVSIAICCRGRMRGPDIAKRSP